jgi:hypothetical protein
MVAPFFPGILISPKFPKWILYFTKYSSILRQRKKIGSRRKAASLWWPILSLSSHDSCNLERMHARVLEISQLGCIHLELLEHSYEGLRCIHIGHEHNVLVKF